MAATSASSSSSSLTSTPSDFDSQLYKYYRMFYDDSYYYESDDEYDTRQPAIDKETFLTDQFERRQTYKMWFDIVVKKKKSISLRHKIKTIYVDGNPLPASPRVTIEFIRSLFTNFKKNLKKTTQIFESIIISNKSFLDAFLEMKAEPKILITTIPEIGTSFYHLLVEMKKLYYCLVVEKIEPTDEHLNTFNSLMNKIKLFFVYPMKKISDNLMYLFMKMT